MSYCSEEILAGKTNLIGLLKSIKNFFLNNEVCKFSVETENYDTQHVYNSYLQLKYKNLIVKFKSYGDDTRSSTLYFTAWDINGKTYDNTKSFINVYMVDRSNDYVYDSSVVLRSIGVFLLKTNDILMIGISPYGITPLSDYLSTSSSSGFVYYEENKNFFKYWISSQSYHWIDGETSMKYSFTGLTNTPKDDTKIIFIPKTQLVNVEFSNKFEDFYEGLYSAAGATAGDFYSFNSKVYFAIFSGILIEAGEKITYNPPQEANT